MWCVYRSVVFRVLQRRAVMLPRALMKPVTIKMRIAVISRRLSIDGTYTQYVRPIAALMRNKAALISLQASYFNVYVINLLR